MVHDFPKELIVLTTEHNFFHIVRQMVNMLQIHPVVLNPYQLMDHRLVRPLVQQRGNGVFFAVTDQKVGLRLVA